MSIRRFIPVSAATLLLAAGFGHAATITLLDDKFDDLGRTNGADANDSQWYIYANAATTAVATTGKLVVSVTDGTSSTGLNPGFTTQFPSHTLATGETISLFFDFSSPGNGGVNANTGLRFGLYNSGASVQSADIGVDNLTASPGAIYQDDKGYSVFAPHQVTGTVQLYSRPANTTNNTLPISGNANSAISGASATLGTATNGTDTYSASLSLTRTLSGIDYAVTYAGTSFTGSTTTVTSDIFNSLTVWGINGQTQPFTIDNVNVSVAAVPEPSAVGLLGACAGLVLRRRR